MASQDAWKKQAAVAAVEAEVEDGMKLGLGTGSTVQFVLEELARRIEEDGLEVVGVATSQRTEQEAERLGIPLATLDVMNHLDVTIDGADEVDAHLDLIKGGGGALLREKVVASASQRVAIVADESKVVDRVGTGFPVPIEIVPFATRVLWPRVQMQGAEVLLREGDNGEPYETDNGHWIFDARFARMADPAQVERAIKQMPGVCEVGIFTGVADTAYVAGEDGVRTLDKPSG